MFSNSFQSGFISVFYSVGSNPLSLWEKSVKNGHIRRVVDDEVKSLVLELSGTNVATTYITCPIKARASLGIKLPFLVMVIKNMKKYFTFEIQIADDKDMRRRFRVSNFQSTTKVRPFCTTMPIGLSPGWNQIQFNLADFTRRAYGSTYLETVRVQVHANVRIRRIYFSDRLYGEDEMPHEFKLFLPIPGTHRQGEVTRKSSKEGERKPSKDAGKLRESVDRIQQIEQEIPSAAPPATPEEASPREEEAPAPEPAPAEPAAETAEEAPAEAAPEPSEAAAEEGPAAEAPAEGEGEAPADAVSEAAPAAEEAPAEDLTTITEEQTGDEPPPTEAEAAEPPAEEEAPAEPAPE